MRKFIKWLLVILGIALLTLAAVILLFLNTLGFSYPTTDMLARQYLIDVINQDAVAAIDLGQDSCGIWLADQVVGDISHYGGTEVRSVQATIIPTSSNSDIEEGVRLDFEYRSKIQTESWHEATIDNLITTYAPPGFRHLCADRSAARY